MALEGKGPEIVPTLKRNLPGAHGGTGAGWAGLAWLAWPRGAAPLRCSPGRSFSAGWAARMHAANPSLSPSCLFTRRHGQVQLDALGALPVLQLPLRARPPPGAPACPLAGRSMPGCTAHLPPRPACIAGPAPSTSPSSSFAHLVGAPQVLASNMCALLWNTYMSYKAHH